MSETAERSRLTLAQYVRRRTGVPLGASGAIRNMLRRSLGASSFAGFWRFWNPVFGYALGRWIYAPLRQRLPDPVALVATFVACGAIHDLVMTAVRGSLGVLFIPWFFFLGVGVVIGRVAGMDLSGRSWAVRAVVQLTYVAACLLLALPFAV